MNGGIIIKTVKCFVVFMLMGVLAACGSKDATDLTGPAAQVLAEIVDATTVTVEAAGEFMFMSMPMDITNVTSQNDAGLSEQEFNDYVEDAANSMAAIGSQAHQIVVIRAKDSKGAGELKKIIAGDTGYDPHKWICVWPEKAAVIESGPYVMIAASTAVVVDAAVDAFKSLAGTHGTADYFFEQADF